MNPNIIHQGTTTHDYDQVTEWCYENCGDFDVGWYRLGRDPLAGMIAESEGRPVADIYYFADETMLTAFLLKWS